MGGANNTLIPAIFDIVSPFSKSDQLNNIRVITACNAWRRHSLSLNLVLGRTGDDNLSTCAIFLTPEFNMK